MSILIKNGTVIDPKSGINAKKDVLIDKGKVIKVASGIKEKAAETIDATGCLVTPGLIDMHTHLREPGREEVEDIASGMSAAVAGGFTTVCPMPNTEPACDSQAAVKFLLERAKEVGLARLVPIGAITKAREGGRITEMGDLKAAGALAVSDDGSSVDDVGVIRTAMEYASMLDLLVISHCEDTHLAGKGVMNEGYTSTVLGLEPIPVESESTIVDRDIRIAELTGARLHIAHVSAAQSVEMIRQAKKRGVNVTAEVTPHHFTLCDEALKTFNPNLKVNPPLRSKSDVEAVKKGLKDGTIDVIATDHAPHAENEKEKEFDYAPFGMIGLETALSLGVRELVGGGYLSWEALLEKLSVNPAKILKTEGGTLKEGSVADVIVIDPDKEWIYEKKNIKSKSSNSPFIGEKMKAKVQTVIVGGKIVVKSGDIV